MQGPFFGSYSKPMSHYHAPVTTSASDYIYIGIYWLFALASNNLPVTAHQPWVPAC